MNEPWREPSSNLRRVLGFAGIAMAVCIAVLMLLTLDAYYRFEPIHPINSPFRWILFSLPALEASALLLRRYFPDHARFRRFSLRMTHLSHATKRWMFDQRHRIIRSVPLIPLTFATFWIPEYLIQPLWTDHEHMLIMARLWDLGEFPWTAMRTYQFPGGMETAWISARLFGWGNPAGFFATSMGLLLGLGFVMIEWSNRILGSRAFGFAGLLALMLIEASQPFTGVAQRDSQATWLIMIAFLAPPAFPGLRFGLFASAVSFALALAIRPHALIFVPLLLCGLFLPQVLDGQIDRLSMRSLLPRLFRNRELRFWLLIFVIAAPVFLSPILGPTRTPAFLEALRFPLSQPGDYSRGAFTFWRKTLKQTLTTDRHVLFLLFSLAMVVVPNPPKWKRLGLILLIIGGCGWLYRAVHPVNHGYLELPSKFWECLGAAIFPAWILTKFRSLPSFALISSLALVGSFAIPVTPVFVSVSEWPAALRNLSVTKPLEMSPPGARYAYPAPPVRYHYDWAECEAVEKWLRENTTNSTRVLNLLTYQPFPSFLATVDRLPLGRLESFVMLIWFTKYDFDTEIVESLRSAPSGSVVIWDNSRINPMHRAQIARTADFIRTTFEEKIRIGEMEIWVKP